VNPLGGRSASDLFDRKEPGHLALCRRIGLILREVLKAEDPAADLDALQMRVNGWVNVNPPGGFNSPHQHSDAHYSGVYYVDVPKSPSGQGGSIEFLSPQPVRLATSAMNPASVIALR